MTKERVIKSTSFSSKDEYEAELLEFASKQSRYFGRYVKRLIADHRARLSQGEDRVPQAPAYDSVQPVSSGSTTHSERKVAEEVKPLKSRVKGVSNGGSHDFADDVSNFV